MVLISCLSELVFITPGNRVKYMHDWRIDVQLTISTSVHNAI